MVPSDTLQVAGFVVNPAKPGRNEVREGEPDTHHFLANKPKSITMARHHVNCLNVCCRLPFRAVADDRCVMTRHGHAPRQRNNSCTATAGLSYVVSACTLTYVDQKLSSS